MKKKELRTTSHRLGFGTLVSALLLLAAGVTSCAKEEDSNRLPDGQYPMTFTAQVEGSTAKKAATRATGKDAWAENDQIAVATNADGSHSKVYQITDAATGEMAPNVAGEACYWQFSKNQPIRAWYPVAGGTDVDISDQSGGYASFDYLTSDGTYDLAQTVALPFKHQMAKVKYTLQKSEGISESDLASATVQIHGYTKASFAGGTLSGHTQGWVMPYAAGHEAIVVPQQMQNKQFIRVTIGADAAQREYFYTPTNATDANLEAGKEYTYNITVKKSELDVTIGTSVSWGEIDLGEGNVEKPTFWVTIPTAVVGVSDLTCTGVTKIADEVYEVNDNANTFSLTYTVPADGTMKGFVVMQGGCDVKRTLTSDGKYMFTYTNISSDLKLAYEVYTEVGDFYCKDNSGSVYLILGNVATLTDTQRAACLGVVFWVGDITNDDPLLKKKFPNGTHGLVVALNDASIGTAWSTQSEDITDNWLAGQGNTYGITSLKVEDKMQGYSNTQALTGYNSSKKVNDNSAFKVLPIDPIATYSGSHTPPTSSSGWYLPSIMELKYVCWGQGNEQSKTGREMLNTQFKKASGTNFEDNYCCWSSSEFFYFRGSAWSVYFISGGMYSDNKDDIFHVRPVLAF